MTTDTMLKASVTTECECVNEDGELADFCFGCDEDNRAWAQEVIDIWLSRQDNQTNSVRVYSPNIGWLRQEAWTITNLTSVLDSVRLNGDYRIVFTLNDKDLSATRYSHDEPTGATFVFNLVEEA